MLTIDLLTTEKVSHIRWLTAFCYLIDPRYHLAKDWSNHLLALSFCLSLQRSEDKAGRVVSVATRAPLRAVSMLFSPATCGAIEQTPRIL
jgi:hypothetical protein